MKRSGRVAILGTLVLGMALGLGLWQAPQTTATEDQVVQIKAVLERGIVQWSPDNVTIKSGEVTFAVTNPSSNLAVHFFAILNADEKKATETNPRPDEVPCYWNGVPVGCGRTIRAGETERVTFKLSAGKYKYICFVHATGGQFQQVGTLTVQD